VKLKGFVCYQSLLHLIAKNTTITWRVAEFK
jgi:hypothetical protein